MVCGIPSLRPASREIAKFNLKKLTSSFQDRRVPKATYKPIELFHLDKITKFNQHLPSWEFAFATVLFLLRVRRIFLPAQWTKGPSVGPLLLFPK